MICIASEVFARNFPVGPERISLDPGNELDATDLTLDHDVDIPAKVAEKIVQALGPRVPVAEQ